MAGVTDIATRLSQQYLLGVLREQMVDSQRQATSGKKSATIAGLGPSGASQSIALRAKTQLFDVYTDNLNAAKTRFQIMDHSLSAVTDEARELLSTLREQLQGTPPKASILSDTAQSALTNVLDKLNTQFNGRYLFAGDDINNRPVNNPAALDTSMTTLVTGWMAGAPTPASVATAARGVVGTGLGHSATSLASSNVSVRVDENTDIDMTLKAHQSGFSDIMRGMSIIANLPQPTTAAEQNNYWSVVNGVINMLEAGVSAVDQSQGILGSRAKIAENLIMQHKDTQSAYEMFLGDVEDVDAAEAAIKFQSLKTQLETSYSIIGNLKDLSLVNYI